MDQADQLSLWLAGAWLRSSGDGIQSLVVEDVEEQVAQGTPVSEVLASIATAKRQPGDFGMEIAGTLLAPVLIEFLKTFWASYLKKLAEEAGSAAATATTKVIKARFVSALQKGESEPVMQALRSGIVDLAGRSKLSPEEAARLLSAVEGGKVPNELLEKK